MARKRTSAAAAPERTAASDVATDAQLQRAKAEYLLAYPSCRRCGAQASLIVHRSDDPSLRLDRTNFVALCIPCHRGQEQAQERIDQ